MLELDLYVYKLPSKILFLLYGSDSHFLSFGQLATLIGIINLFLRLPVYGYFMLGLFGANNNFSLLTLSESIKSAASFLLFFYAIYWIAKFYYGKEAFGRGDYWLAMALGSFIHLETLPHFLLLASVLGICFALIDKKKKNFYLLPLL